MKQTKYEIIPKVHKFAEEILNLAEEKEMTEAEVNYLPGAIEGILEREKEKSCMCTPYKRPRTEAQGNKDIRGITINIID